MEPQVVKFEGGEIQVREDKFTVLVYDAGGSITKKQHFFKNELPSEKPDLPPAALDELAKLYAKHNAQLDTSEKFREEQSQSREYVGNSSDAKKVSEAPDGKIAPLDTSAQFNAEQQQAQEMASASEVESGSKSIEPQL